METSFSGGRSQSTRREPPTIIQGKQLVNFITYVCESRAPTIIDSIPSPRLSISGPMAHKALMHGLHLYLTLPSCSSLVCLFLFLQVVSGHPTLRFQSGCHVNALYKSCCCPYIRHGLSISTFLV